MTHAFSPAAPIARRAGLALLLAAIGGCGVAVGVPADDDEGLPDVPGILDTGAEDATGDAGPVDAAADLALPDLAPLDTSEPDATAPDADETDAGPIACDELLDCPVGWVCVDLTVGDTPGFCAPSCSSDAQCRGLDCVTIRDGETAFGACVDPDLCLDADGDGFGTGPGCRGSDCDETNGAINPAATEVCNGSDDNCDGVNDNNAVESGDDCVTGFPGVCGEGRVACESGLTSCVARYVAADERCDGADNDCDSTVDEDAVDAPAWYRDADGDRFGVTDDTINACAAPAGYVAEPGDCDDDARTVYPAASDLCDGVDNDCDETVDEDATASVVTWYRDADGDLYGDDGDTVEGCAAPEGYVAVAGDCNDGERRVNPGVPDACDGDDSDCDGTVDEDAPVLTWYRDADGDRWGTADDTAEGCAAPVGYVADDGDCDDDDRTLRPDAIDACDRIDNDCDEAVDEDGGELFVWYRDGDGDRWGDPSDTVVACGAPGGYVGEGRDCRDDDAAINPGALEVCDTVDNNCDGVTDDTLEGAALWYLDGDGDSWGDGRDAELSCRPVPGRVRRPGDCDDARFAVNPDAVERCNGVDDNCDGGVDDASAVNQRTWYRDADTDGYGRPGGAVTACDAPGGYVANSEDCNDGNGAINPDATEVCNEVDDNCNSATDEGVSRTFYRDADTDTFGDALTRVTACARPEGFVENATDCDDSTSLRRPGLSEVCDSLDNDCNGLPDDGLLETFYRDADGDTYGNALVTTRACVQPSGYVRDATDCDDTTGLRYPGRAEVCDNLDNDCNGLPDDGAGTLWYIDNDGDGYGGTEVRACQAPANGITRGGDCNDANNAVNPAARETCTTTFDDNCNSAANESSAFDAAAWYLDNDGDGQGPTDGILLWPAGQRACTKPADFCPVLGLCFIERFRYVSNTLDCDDGTARARSGGGPEVSDGYDNDCNGTRDDGLCTPRTRYFRDEDGDGWTAGGSAIEACTAPVDAASDWTTVERCCDSDDDDAFVN